jgi:hypothetical protein
MEPTIIARERPQTHALDRTATGIGGLLDYPKDSKLLNKHCSTEIVTLSNFTDQIF